MERGSTRRDPPPWDHQRHVLRALGRAIEAAAPRLGLEPGDRVVDLGCGDRPYEPVFTALDCDYVGCDLDGPCDVRITPGQPVPLPDGSAAAVVSFQVLEHVWDVGAYLAEARRLLAPGGRLLLSTHGTWLFHPHPTDFRRWTRTGLVGELEAAGFEVERIEGLVGPLAWTTQFRLLGLRHALARVPVLGPGAVAVAATLMNARMAIEDAVTPAAIRDDNAAVYLAVARPTHVPTKERP